MLQKKKKRRKEETNTSQQQKLSTKLSHSIFRITSNFFIHIAKYTKNLTWTSKKNRKYLKIYKVQIKK